jgi:hypothetical protein
MSQQERPESISNEEDRLVSLSEACRMIVSPRPGKKTHLSTIYRWILDGRLPAVRRGRWWFVRVSDIMRLNVEFTARPRASLPIATTRQERAAQKWTDETLARFGL